MENGAYFTEAWKVGVYNVSPVMQIMLLISQSKLKSSNTDCIVVLFTSDVSIHTSRKGF